MPSSWPCRGVSAVKGPESRRGDLNPWPAHYEVEQGERCAKRRSTRRSATPLEPKFGELSAVRLPSLLCLRDPPALADDAQDEPSREQEPAEPEHARRAGSC